MAKPSSDPEDVDLFDETLSTASSEEQAEAMRQWFGWNYENPAEQTPYVSAEGGYIYIWGGPYDADDVLQDRFGDVVPLKVIQELARELTNEAWEWAPAPWRHEVDEEGNPDDLPPDLPPEIVQRHKALIDMHEQWLLQHPLPEPGTQAGTEAILNRMEEAERILHALIGQGRAMLAQPPGIGHNGGPPGDVVQVGELPTDPPVAPEVAQAAVSSLVAARPEVGKESPGLGVLQDATTHLSAVVRSVGLWIARNLNLAVEEFSKGFGKTLGVAAAASITAVGVVTAFGDIRSALSAIGRLIMAHLPF